MRNWNFPYNSIINYIYNNLEPNYEELKLEEAVELVSKADLI